MENYSGTCNRLTDFTPSLAALGARVTHLRLRLLANHGAELDFTQHGIPESATILWLNYTPHGGNCWPLEIHGNTPPRRFRGTKISLYGVQMKTSEGIPIEEEFEGNNIGVMVLWAPAADSDTPWLYLVDAIEAVTLGRFSQAIVPAHAATEIATRPTIHSLLFKYSADTQIEKFLKQEQQKKLAFYSILNEVLPLVAALAGAKPLPDAITVRLHTLRDRRNDFVHEGLLPTTVDATQIRELLCAATFGFEYAKYLQRFL